MRLANRENLSTEVARLELPLLSDTRIESVAQLPTACSLPVLRRSRFSRFRPRSPSFGMKLSLLSDGQLEAASEFNACFTPVSEALALSRFPRALASFGLADESLIGLGEEVEERPLGRRNVYCC